jgi:hypothetical protein
MVKKASSKKKKTSKAKNNKRKTLKKGKTTKIIHQSTKEIRVEKTLIENFVALQKVMVNLSSKFDHLSNQISKLLEVFEISAKSLANKDFEMERGARDDRRILDKIDGLSQQAGLIGKGLALIHESRGEDFEDFEEEPPMQRPSPPSIQRSTPPPEFQRLSRPPTIPKIPKKPTAKIERTPKKSDVVKEVRGSRGTEGYQESIASASNEIRE